MNTPTPRTETDLFEATKVSLEYGNQRLFKKSQSTRIVGEVAFSDGYEYALKHSSKIKQLERELTAVTEQRDAVTLRLGDTQVRMFNAERQRDRLAEALRKAISWGDSASHHILYRQKINWTYLNEAREALQSLNQPTP